MNLRLLLDDFIFVSGFKNPGLITSIVGILVFFHGS